MTSHTPTPWALVEGPKARGSIKSVCKGLPQSIVAQAGGQPTVEEREANAAFIVNACNAHDALVKALKGLLIVAESDAQMPGAHPMRMASVEHAKAALLAATPAQSSKEE